MLDWTGERFVPWAKEAAVAYEHLHRYLWSSNFIEDKRVLDLASGEGYGGEILARRAAFVCGVDIDAEAIRHASERYRRPNLEFIKGCLTSVPVSDAHSFDVITCFEALEHIDQHDEMMREVKRLLKPGGLFVAVTNGDAHTAGLRIDAGGAPLVTRFSSENGAEALQQHFERVTREDIATRAVFPDHAAAVAYLATTDRALAAGLPPFEGPREYAGATTVFLAH